MPPHRTWIFQANPRKYNIEGALPLLAELREDLRDCTIFHGLQVTNASIPEKAAAELEHLFARDAAGDLS